MFYQLDIRYPEDEIGRNEERFERTYNFGFLDRVPVLIGTEARYYLHARGISFDEYFSSAETQFVHLLENIKWRIENIPDDWLTERSITVTPDFQNVLNASGCGCDIFWKDHDTPLAIPRIGSIDEMIRYELPDWRTTLWGRKAEWFSVMKGVVERTDVRLNGERIPIKVTLSIMGDSPFMSAIDLTGGRFYAWLIDAPDECRSFLGRITDLYVEVESEFRRISGRPMSDGLTLSDDSGQVISPKQYREFCVPFAKRLYDTFGCTRHDGRVMHLCGRNVHLHSALMNDLHITMLHGFGSANKPEEMSLLAGKVILQGNLDPMILFQGSVDDVEIESMNVLKTLGPSGGLILGDGYNIAPGTPVEMFSAVRRASEQFGIPKTTTQYSMT
jgi:Uroporphyrinogen decarboxylase (URO-D)